MPRSNRECNENSTFSNVLKMAAVGAAAYGGYKGFKAWRTPTGFSEPALGQLTNKVGRMNAMNGVFADIGDINKMTDGPLRAAAYAQRGQRRQMMNMFSADDLGSPFATSNAFKDTIQGGVKAANDGYKAFKNGFNEATSGHFTGNIQEQIRNAYASNSSGLQRSVFTDGMSSITPGAL